MMSAMGHRGPEGAAFGRMDGGSLLLGFLLLGFTGAVVLSRSLNVLALGDEAAEQLGVSVPGTQRVLLLATSLMVGAAVSVAGLVGFGA